MSNQILRLGSMVYDQFGGITDGKVRVPGYDIEHTTSALATDIFEGMMKGHQFDIAELGLTFYLRSLDFEDAPFIALPVFPARVFRHSAIYVNTSSGIRAPQDLAGKRIGEFVTYGHDAGVWAKGILSDDFGLTPDQSRWIVGGLERPIAPIDYLPFLHPDDVDVTVADDGVDLGAMLDRGEIDALISGNVPFAIRNGSPNVTRLFPDFKPVEQAWFTDTGIFPMMHVIVVKKTLLDQNPRLASQLYDAFTASKALALQAQDLGQITNFVDVMIPWLNDLVAKNRQVHGQEWWAYGVDANRHAIDTFLRYHHEQGLSKRRWQADEIFAAEVVDT